MERFWANLDAIVETQQEIVVCFGVGIQFLIYGLAVGLEKGIYQNYRDLPKIVHHFTVNLQ